MQSCRILSLACAASHVRLRLLTFHGLGERRLRISVCVCVCCCLSVLLMCVGCVGLLACVFERVRGCVELSSVCLHRLLRSLPALRLAEVIPRQRMENVVPH